MERKNRDGSYRLMILGSKVPGDHAQKEPSPEKALVAVFGGHTLFSAVVFVAALVVVSLLVFAIASCVGESSHFPAVLGNATARSGAETSTHPSLPGLAQEEEALSAMTVQQDDAVNLDVALINQMDDDEEGEQSLYNGCEVTSMAMLLNYAGVVTTKEEVADRVAVVPLWVDDGAEGVYGNPNEGFVGSMTAQDGEAGYSVYHEPIAAAARAVVGRSGYTVVDITGQSFDFLLKELKSGNPVWTITTTSFSPSEKWEVWPTTSGPIAVSWDVHSVVVTGFDATHVYVNDPYGDKGVVYDREDFKAAWEQMGSQAVVVHS